MRHRNQESSKRLVMKHQPSHGFVIEAVDGRWEWHMSEPFARTLFTIQIYVKDNRQELEMDL